MYIGLQKGTVCIVAKLPDLYKLNVWLYALGKLPLTFVKMKSLIYYTQLFNCNQLWNRSEINQKVLASVGGRITIGYHFLLLST